MLSELDDQTLVFVTVIAIGRTLLFFGVGTMLWRWLQWSRRREALGELLYRKRLGRIESLLILPGLLGMIAVSVMLAWLIARIDSDCWPYGGISMWPFEPFVLQILLLWCLVIHCVLYFFMPIEFRATGCCTGGWRLVPWSRMTQGIWGAMPIQAGWERLVRHVRRIGRDRTSGEAVGVSPPSAKHIFVLDSEEVLPVTFWVPKSQAEAVEEVAGRFVPIVDVEPRPRYAQRRFYSLLFRDRRIWRVAALFCVVLAANIVLLLGNASREAEVAARLERGGAEVDTAILHVFSVDFGKETRPTEEQLLLLKRLPRLASLSFRGSTLNDQLAEHLAPLTSLAFLDLGQTQITDAGLAHLSQMKSMRCLLLDRVKITGDGLRHLESMQKLDTLLVPGTQMTESGMQSISRLSALRSLTLSKTPTQDTWLAPLEKLPHLESLSLDRTLITDAGVETLAKFKGLKLLSLSETRITDKCADALKQMTHLENLHIQGTEMSPEVIGEVRRALEGVGVLWEEEEKEEDPAEDLPGAEGEIKRPAAVERKDDA